MQIALRVIFGVVGTVLMTLAGLSPVWLYLWARSSMHPEGFWQELALGVVGISVLGAVQLICGLLWIAGVLQLWVWIWEQIRRIRWARRRNG